MDSISKRQKPVEEVKTKESEEEEEDRISNFPSCVMGHILSFLPAKDAVAISILSTKWKQIWKSISNLDFDDGLVSYRECHDPYSKKYRESQESIKKSFTSFVYRVLTLHVSDLQKFHLRCNRCYDDSHVNSWVIAALSRNVRELHLYLCRLDNLLPSELFTCSTLLSLKLHGHLVLNFPTLIHLENLKILYLDAITFSDDESIKRLFSSCPLLEDLSIRCLFVDITEITISAPALKSLIIDCRPVDGWTIECKYKVVLNTPNLQNFDYDDYAAEDYSLNELNSLVTAKINLLSYIPKDLFWYMGETSDPVRDQSVLELSVAKFVEGISKVQRLYLSRASVETLQLCRYPLPKFPHLIYLELDNDWGWIGSQILLDFLENSPQLETLIFVGLLEDEDEENQTHRWYTPENVPSCMLFHLKVIRIRRFLENRNGMQMTKYLLKNSKVLKELVIQSYSDNFRVVRKVLLKLPRGSKTCQVKFLHVCL